MQEGAENAIYYAPNRRILNVALGRTSGVKPKLGKQVESDSDKKWYEAELIIKTTKNNLTNDVKPLYKAANDM
ncbi:MULTISPECIES: hypothetical protein [Helicobacter]|uniref:DUF3519 domain-containing protein n=1 Tax=Helicobacter ibis TaxID=2962633 RepID=A0ABT4VDN3_9HELI|nr:MULTISPECIES: hypothetical protein [Helicobacter]MDA3966930.1 hypothetical protein [Helicobacter sp. WB40]MDA3968156.1 hypothetical protein [Helicobacter ibis]